MSYSYNIVSISSNNTLSSTADVSICNVSGGNITLNINPNITSFNIKLLDPNSTGNSVTIIPPTGATINGAASYAIIDDGRVANFIKYNNNWEVMTNLGAQLSVTTAKGDIITSDGTSIVALGVGADGAYLTADSGETTGLLWAAAPAPTPNSIASTPTVTLNGVVRWQDAGGINVVGSGVVINSSDDVSGVGEILASGTIDCGGCYVINNKHIFCMNGGATSLLVGYDNVFPFVGIYNVTLGDGAGAGRTSGSTNTIIGSAMVTSSPTTTYSVGIGYSSKVSTNGVTCGNNSGTALTAASTDDIIIGHNAFTMTAVDSCVAIGNNTNTSGNDTVLLGHNTKGGSKDVVIGYGSGNLTSGNTLNVIVGRASATTGFLSRNVLIGNNVGANISSLTYSVLIGENANVTSGATAPTTHTQLVGIGKNAIANSGDMICGNNSRGGNLPTPTYNVVIGDNIATSTGMGSGNVLIGYSIESPQMSTLTNAVACGYGAVAANECVVAGHSAVAGARSVAIGISAIAGTDSVAFGAYSSADGSYRTAFGHSAVCAQDNSVQIGEDGVIDVYVNKAYHTRRLYMATAGGTPSGLRYHEQTTHTTQMLWGGALSSNQTFKLQRTGRIVHLTIPVLTIGSSQNAIITSISAIPTAFRPQQDSEWPVIITTNGVNSVGLLRVSSLGSVSFLTESGGSINGSITGGYLATGVSYAID